MTPQQHKDLDWQIRFASKLPETPSVGCYLRRARYKLQKLKIKPYADYYNAYVKHQDARLRKDTRDIHSTQEALQDATHALLGLEVGVG